ncbi:MAG: DUF1292 domain-containing protein [Lachnospiraceae bacterium]|nr:DUF1292 domain-containing protein [Lachnospiraceae bacterium]
MNAKNQALFFDEDNGLDAIITLTDEYGNDMDMEAVASLAIEELGKEYIAVVPLEPNEEFEEGEVLLLIYSEDKKGNPVFESLDDPEEFEIVSTAFEEFIEQMSEDDDDEDYEEEITDDNYLDDIAEIIPGVSIKVDK